MYELFNLQLLGNRVEYSNTDYAVTGYIICVIPHITEDVLENAYVKHMKQVNFVIKFVFHGT